MIGRTNSLLRSLERPPGRPSIATRHPISRVFGVWHSEAGTIEIFTLVAGAMIEQRLPDFAMGNDGFARGRRRKVKVSGDKVSVPGGVMQWEYVVVM